MDAYQRMCRMAAGRIISRRRVLQRVLAGRACQQVQASNIMTVSTPTGRSFNGRTPRSGRGYRGSNPCLPAN
jgi:hypothetical protein